MRKTIMGLRYSGIDSIPEIYVLEEPKKKSKSMKLGFWDRFLLRKYSSRLLILINQISNLERYLKKTKSFTTRCMFIAEIAKLNKEFQKYESKCREIEDGRN